MEFKILKKSKISRARLGLLKTSQGVVETPCLVPVATQAVVKTLTSEEVEKTKTQILIANTFHLHLKPGEKIIKQAGGLHQFMNWERPLMTDSGGFQVFSLGFGKDLGIGKILAPYRPARGGAGTGLKYFPGFARGRASGGAEKRKISIIKEKSQPKSLKITDDGVYFRSFLNGDQMFLGPKESIKIQEALGADIIFTFDECTSPLADYDYTKKSLERTHKWAKICLESKKSKQAPLEFGRLKGKIREGGSLTGQALFGIVQGGRFKDLRKESAKFIGFSDFDGFGIGGEFGENKKMMSKMISWVIDELPEEKPRHLLGIGYLEDIEKIIKAGIDMFDCTVPTHYARRGIAFTGKGEFHPHTKREQFAFGGKIDEVSSRYGVGINLKQSKFLKDKKPLDKKCQCFVCQSYTRSYISHLVRAGEITALSLLTFHNLYFFNTFVEKIRDKIKKGKMLF